MKIILFFLISIGFTQTATAGIFEVSASTSYRESSITADNSQVSQSYTASVSYYFFEMSALELSYTEGTSTLTTKISSTSTKFKYISKFKMVGADLVLTFAEKGSAFKPYIKGGFAQVTKQLEQEDELGTAYTPLAPSTEKVPSAGAGIKLKITQALSFKVGYDIWFTDTSGGRKEDQAWRAGLSWMF